MKEKDGPSSPLAVLCGSNGCLGISCAAACCFRFLPLVEAPSKQPPRLRSASLLEASLLTLTCLELLRTTRPLFLSSQRPSALQLP